jgi:hypothetical protein
MAKCAAGLARWIGGIGRCRQPRGRGARWARAWLVRGARCSACARCRPSVPVVVGDVTITDVGTVFQVTRDEEAGTWT